MFCRPGKESPATVSRPSQVPAPPRTPPHQQDPDGWTPLHHAAFDNRVAELIALLGRGADPNRRTREGDTPLHLAMPEAALELVARGGDVNAPNHEGDTPLLLHAANPLVVEALLRAGADPRRANLHGETPLHHAVAASAALLLGHGADPNARLSANGWTPLHQAVIGGEADLVGLLLRAGARCDLPDRWGRSPMTLALEKGYDHLCHLLPTAGAESNTAQR